MLTKNPSDETVTYDIIDDHIDEETNCSSSDDNTDRDLLMDADDIILPMPLLTPSVVAVPSSKPTSLLDNVQLSGSPSDILSSEQLFADDPASAEGLGSANCVQSKAPSVVTVKTEQPVAVKFDEPFGFVNDVLKNYVSPAKKLATDTDRCNKRPFNP